MKQLPILIQRELWEHKSTFLIMPAVIMGLFVALLLLAILLAEETRVSVDADWEGANQTHELVIEDSSFLDLFDAQALMLASMPEDVRAEKLNKLFNGASVPWGFTLWIVVFFYLLGALFDDRKDRSVLFWKSMPVSDSLTVVSKLLAGLVVAPMIYLGFIMLAHLILALVATLLMSGQEAMVWQALWDSADLLGRWVNFLLIYGITLFWCLPVFGWLLLVSSWAKTAPLFWAIGIPVVVVMIEAMLFSGGGLVGDFIERHVISLEFWQSDSPLSNFGLATALELLSSMVIGFVLIGLAVWQRGKADEI